MPPCRPPRNVFRTVTAVSGPGVTITAAEMPRNVRTDASIKALPSASGVRALQLIDVDLLHLEHCLHDPAGLMRIGIADQLDEGSGNDLPRQAVLVLGPAAVLGACHPRRPGA